MTTNGVLLSRYAAELKEAGLRRVNVSLDSLKPDKFKAITGGDNFSAVINGIGMARQIGLNPVKINVVVMAGVNDDEIIDFARKTVTDGWNVRFIELMPVNGQSGDKKFVSIHDMKDRLWELGKMEPHKAAVGNGPAKYYRLPGAEGTIGFISPVTEHFCFQCNRLRLTADGRLRACLMSEDETDLKTALRGGAPLDTIKNIIKDVVARKPLQHHLADSSLPDQHRPFSQIGG